MKHHKQGRKLGRERNQKKALMKTLATSLIKHEKITTTEAKAKELRPYIEKLVTNAKSDTLATKRLILSRLGTNPMSKKLVAVIAPRYVDRKGGYTRVIKIMRRASDASKMAQIEFV